MNSEMQTRKLIVDSAVDALATKPFSSNFVDSDSVLPRVGGYELICELGRGGMGIVYAARQIQLNRIVALKTISGIGNCSVEQAQRFRLEAQTLAKLNHNNIVPIIDFFSENGSLYLAMGYIKGFDLETRLANGPMNCREAANLVVQTANAIEYAHQQGIIHRDLKPANVLVDDLGRCLVTDFGLARLTAEEHGLTVTGQIIGTPEYMSPEQAIGDRGQVSIHSDVYALGAILYRSVTGVVPFSGNSVSEVLHKVVNNEPTLPSSLRASVDKDINVICLKCLEKDPKFRFQSAQEVANELSRYLHGEPIQSRPLSIVTRMIRSIRKRPTEAALAIAVVLCVGLASSLIVGVTSSQNFTANSLHSTAIGQTHVLIFVAAMGPIFSICRGLGPRRLRWLEDYALRNARAIFALFINFGALMARFSAFLLIVFLLKKFRDVSTSPEGSLTSLTSPAVVAGLGCVFYATSLWFLKWRKWLLPFVIVYVLANLSTYVTLHFVSQEFAAGQSLMPIIVMFALIIVTFALGVPVIAGMCIIEFVLVVRFWKAFNDSLSNAFEEAIGWDPIAIGGLKMGLVLFLVPIPFLLPFYLLAILAFASIAICPLLIAEFLRRRLTPGNPTFTDLVAYGFSIFTLVVLLNGWR